TEGSPRSVFLISWLSSFFFSSRRRHTRSKRDWSSDVCSSDLYGQIVEDFNAAQEDVYINFQVVPGDAWDQKLKAAQAAGNAPDRSEERRVGKECRTRGSREEYKKK